MNRECARFARSNICDTKRSHVAGISINARISKKCANKSEHGNVFNKFFFTLCQSPGPALPLYQVWSPGTPSFIPSVSLEVYHFFKLIRRLLIYRKIFQRPFLELLKLASGKFMNVYTHSVVMVKMYPRASISNDSSKYVLQNDTKKSIFIFPATWLLLENRVTYTYIHIYGKSQMSWQESALASLAQLVKCSYSIDWASEVHILSS